VWRNKLTYTGSFIALIAFIFILSFLFFDLISRHPSPYIGLFTFLILPGFLLLGLVLAGVGLLVSRQRLKHRLGAGAEAQYLPRIDLNQPRHRHTLLVLGAIIALAIPFIGVMSYEGYHYSDSDPFCGLVCHSVMDPQYTAHLNSPHARVQCANCHIGRGATWYVKSKLSGVHQVIAVMLNTYPRPIPPAITELRPATATCQQCHWPARFYGDQLVRIHHFASDEHNSPERIQLLVKTGGSDVTTGPPSGIHWHMALGHSIEFVATDRGLQQIPWVRATDHRTKKQVVYRSDGRSSTDPPPDGIHRTVDCMDCHNRATHIFRSPDQAVDDAFNVDPTLRTLPFGKRQLVAALVEPYPDKSAGLERLSDALRSFYRSKYPKVLDKQAEVLDRLISAGREIYRLNFFPEMDVTWRTYPTNIGHKEFPGCFRCHDKAHKDAVGKPISHDCSTCHSFLVPAQAKDKPSLMQIGGFVHPVALKGRHASIRCDRCHTGGVAPARTCAGCHASVTSFRAGTTPAFSSFGISAEPMDGIVGCEDCHDLSQPTDAETLNKACLECHDEDLKGIVKKWQDESSKLFQQAAAQVRSSDKVLLQDLRAAGPLHNMDATRKVLTALGARNGSQP
jgi:hypothetical protein